MKKRLKFVILRAQTKIRVMFRWLGFLLVVGSVFGLSHHALNQHIPLLEAKTLAIIDQAKLAKLDPQAWDEVVAKAEADLPWYYPFSNIKSAVSEARDMVYRVDNFKGSVKLNFSFADRSIDPEGLYQLFEFLADQSESIDHIINDVEGLPTSLLSAEQQIYLESQIRQLNFLKAQLEDAQKFEKIFKKFLKDEERILVLLQNQNEPRSTGGFVGSLVLFDFSPQAITWKFLDIYELDRLIPGEAQLPAPPFFHGLSKTISLRDANFWPDFKTSSLEYRYFLEAAGQKPPRTVVAINLNLVEEVLKMTGPVSFDRWNVELNQYNFDTVLQFLVESKISGRYAVKAPVEQFAGALFSSDNLSNISWDTWQQFDLSGFLAQKNILAHSQNLGLQKLFEKWGLDGQLRQKKDADNFLHFDFVSIGANKSEKFVWTKIAHDSDIRSNGAVINTLKIKRTHSLRPGELNDLLGTDSMSQNVKDLINETLWWKLGAGQNRTILRVWVPKEARLISQTSPSGPIRTSMVGNSEFKVFEIPMFVLPSETLELDLVYETRINRGSAGWRPYYLELVGTPGRDKTTILPTVSMPKGATFTAETKNIGLPVPLTDQDFRAIVRFKN